MPFVWWVSWLWFWDLQFPHTLQSSKHFVCCCSYVVRICLAVLNGSEEVVYRLYTLPFLLLLFLLLYPLPFFPPFSALLLPLSSPPPPLYPPPLLILLLLSSPLAWAPAVQLPLFCEGPMTSWLMKWSGHCMMPSVLWNGYWSPTWWCQVVGLWRRLSPSTLKTLPHPL